MRIKAGYKTSEFWFTLVSFIFSGLYLTGILKENEHKEELITVVSHAVESVILISGQVFILYKYIKGRTEVKKIAETTKVNSESEDSKNVTKPRTNKTRSRKTNTKHKRKTPRS
jgi:ABC-type Mn2+/Zn2+ transport system ATPase subunit